ncbi:MAG TPA: thioredoxin domain-containing protein [Polyangiales bacterium]
MNHIIHPAPARALFVTLSLVLASQGCNQPPPAAKASPTACADYTKRICKEAGGDDSPTCASIKTATELMPPEACAAGLANVDFAVKQLASKRKKCDELVTKLCTDLGPTTATCDMVKTHTKSFPPERCDMMMQHYTEVLADLKRQEDKNKPLAPEKLAKLTEGEPASFGPATAKVTVVEFSDFQCPFCSRAATAVEQLRTKYGDKVHFVFRQFPLSFHQNAHTAAEASMAAKAQGKFWEFHDKLFANQQKLDRPSLEGFAKDVGLDVAKFKKALDDKTYAPAVDAEQKLGEEVAVDGTPTMFLNGSRIPNPTDYDAITKQIDAAIKAAGG